jgi:hypothetical protein
MVLPLIASCSLYCFGQRAAEAGQPLFDVVRCGNLRLADLRAEGVGCGVRRVARAGRSLTFCSQMGTLTIS